MPAIYKNGRVYGGKAQELEDLTNVNIDTSTLDDGQGLIYDETNDEWVNGNVSSGGGTAATTTFDDTNVEFEADDVQEAFEEITKTITQAEYDALSSTEKLNGTIYLISDGTATNVVECTQATYPATPEQDTFYLISDAPSLQGTSADLLYESGSATTTKAKIDSKADQSTTYTKTEVDTALGNKADTSDVVLKTDLIIAKDLTIPANTSIADAIKSIITTYGKNPIMFSFIITGDNYYEGFINFYSNFVGGGYVVKTSTSQNVFYSLAYANNSVYVSEKADKNQTCKLVQTYVVYDSTDSAFKLPSTVKDKPTMTQMTIVGRNTQTGALYALWWNTVSEWFQLGATITGSAPANGNSCYIQYTVPNT